MSKLEVCKKLHSSKIVKKLQNKVFKNIISLKVPRENNMYKSLDTNKINDNSRVIFDICYINGYLGKY